VRNLGNFISTTDEKEWIAVSCRTIQSIIKKKLRDLPSVNIAISGGTTPQSIFQELIKGRYLADDEWKKIHFFWVDERLVPHDSKGSNYGNALTYLKKTPSTLYPMYDIKMGEKQSLAVYRQLLKKIKHENGFPAFDLLLLGMGTDGHTASLFPMSEGLSELKQSVIIQVIKQLNCKRMSLTFPVLKNANECLILLNGKEKIKILQDLIEKEQDYPIELLLSGTKPKTWIYYN
jgi:6-phosphogluconolactonase